MNSIILATAVLSFAAGTGVLYANPRRFLNQVFALALALLAVWIWMVYRAASAGVVPGLDPLPWLRANTGLAAFFPWAIWLIREAVIDTERGAARVLLRSWPWFLTSAILCAICLIDSYQPSESVAGSYTRGSGYTVFFVASLVLYLVLLTKTVLLMRRSSGIKYTELQFLTFNASFAALAVVIVLGLGNFLEARWLSRLSPLVFLPFFALTAWAVTVHRVFNARQIFLSVIQRLGIVTVLVAGVMVMLRLLADALPAPVDLVVSIALCSSLAFWVERLTRDWLRLSPWQNTAAMRQTALDLARREPDPNRLVAEFESLLRSSCQTGYAVLLFDSGEVFVSGDIEFPKDRTGYAALCKQGWSTPESLQRLRPEPGLVDLRQFLTEFNLGVVVTAPRGSPAPSLLLALGVKTNQRPFTYPEVQQVQEIAEFLDNILARSRLSLQARQSEQLATIGLIGASLAHEIRNPLVSIKTFSHLLPSRFDDPEFRRRFALLIPAEVDRIDSLTQQLLDLSNPRRHQMERVSLHGIMQETTDLMLTRANEARVLISAELNATADTIWADAGAVRQVLINLLINAFQAMENQEGARRVLLRSRNSPNGSVILEVSDNGPGIPPEQRSRLFHPFVSTKTKGMGLGLAVCADILHEHRATIIVPDIGKPGATFRITFPCPPPSS
jgi:signal transduction histidine kinase